MCVYILKEGVGALQIRQTNFLTCLEMSDSLMIPMENKLFLIPLCGQNLFV